MEFTASFDALLSMAAKARNNTPAHSHDFIKLNDCYWMIRDGLWRYESGLPAYTQVVSALDYIPETQTDEYLPLVDRIRILHSLLIDHPLECSCVMDNQSCPVCRCADFLATCDPVELGDLSYLNYQLLI